MNSSHIRVLTFIFVSISFPLHGMADAPAASSSSASNPQARAFFVPPRFAGEQGDKIINEVEIVTDVDGVVRESWRNPADPRVVAALKTLLRNKDVRVHVTFLSGSLVALNDNGNWENQPEWKKGHFPLRETLASYFAQEVSEGKVTILGAAGNHQLMPDGTTKVRDEYTPQQAAELVKLNLYITLKEHQERGDAEQQKIATELLSKLDVINPSAYRDSVLLAGDYFVEIILAIRKHLDPEFRVVIYGPSVESHASKFLDRGEKWLAWFKVHVAIFPHLKRLLLHDRNIFTGDAVNPDGTKFNWLTAVIKNKGEAIQPYMQEVREKSPNAAVFSFGDAANDFPTHKKSDLAFHVGTKKVYEKNLPDAPQTIMVVDKDGKDGLFVEGNLQMLALLEKALGKSFNDLKYILRRNASGQESYYSVNDIKQGVVS
jgi:hypothetical protein